MEKILPDELPEILFASSQPKISRSISQLLAQGKIKKLFPKVYTSNLTDSAEKIIQRNFYFILGRLFPGAVISYRSAFELKPTKQNQFFLTYSYTKRIRLPGYTVHLLKGHGPVTGDTKYLDVLYLASRERAYLENMQQSRKTDEESKTLRPEEIKNKLDNYCLQYGEEELNKFRDRIREKADLLDMQAAYKKLARIFSALLATNYTNILKSPLARARALGKPYDAQRIELFHVLFTALTNSNLLIRPERNNDHQALFNLSFFEAYFSNYIEGTTFAIDEAKSIIFNTTPLINRPADSHDILGTFNIINNQQEMSRTPASVMELINILIIRHKILMAGRVDESPGQFKQQENRAGSTLFVKPELVTGTLEKGFEIYAALEHPLAKAIFIMFLISEVHPFRDGNGRLARIMMNAELVKAKLTRILIPTVYREDYLLALRRLSRKQEPATYIKMLDYIQAFCATLNFMDFDAVTSKLKEYNAFSESDEGRLLWQNSEYRSPL
jgi:hypothetical protein